MLVAEIEQKCWFYFFHLLTCRVLTYQPQLPTFKSGWYSRIANSTPGAYKHSPRCTSRQITFHQTHRNWDWQASESIIQKLTKKSLQLSMPRNTYFDLLAFFSQYFQSHRKGMMKQKAQLLNEKWRHGIVNFGCTKVTWLLHCNIPGLTSIEKPLKPWKVIEGNIWKYESQRRFQPIFFEKTPLCFRYSGLNSTNSANFLAKRRWRLYSNKDRR